MASFQLPESESAYQWLKHALSVFSSHSSSDARDMKAYMKNKFEFYGIKKPLRAELQRKIYHEAGLPGKEVFREIVCLLWEDGHRESHYLAMDILFKNRKHFVEDDIYLIEELMRSNSWWDSIDFLSPHLAAAWFKLFPLKKEQTLLRWNSDSDFWLRRASLIAQLHCKKETDTDLLFRLIVPLAREKEFFIRKAIGWSLRELAKINPGAVIDFIGAHDISPLSRKEALKHISLSC
jgi:3-methyladenine DNA glycosylase AlkD